MSRDSYALCTPSESVPALPFLKWAGGKRWVASVIAQYAPAVFGRYYEPFLGGGAVFFHLAPCRAVLSDVNSELINAYVQVAQDLNRVIEGLERLKVNQRTYLSQKRAKSTCELERAVRFIYLNKTAFNGLYRVNRSGEFNVPFAGNQGRVLYDHADLRIASQILKNSSISTRDFEESLAEAKAGDLAYCDPPYTVKHDNNGFIRYNEGLFSWDDQRRLAAAAKEAVRRGVHVIISNAHHEAIRRLYKGFRGKSLTRASCMSGVSTLRGRVSEYLFIGTPESN